MQHAAQRIDWTSLCQQLPYYSCNSAQNSTSAPRGKCCCNTWKIASISAHTDNLQKDTKTVVNLSIDYSLALF